MTRAQRNESDHHITRAQRSERIREMARQAYSSRRIATAVGVSAQTVRDTAKRHGIDIHADKITGRTRHFDPNRIVNQIIYGLEGTQLSISTSTTTSSTGSRCPSGSPRCEQPRAPFGVTGKGWKPPWHSQIGAALFAIKP